MTQANQKTRISFIGPGSSLLFKMILVAVGIHLILILVTSRNLLFSDKESPEQIYQKGEDAMAAGHYLEAMDYYQRVLDMQPKLPPVFEKAAEQHRVADRLAKQQAARPLPTQPAEKPIPATTSERARPTSARGHTLPTPQFQVPPELRGK